MHSEERFKSRSSLLFYFLKGNKHFFIFSMIAAALVALFDLTLPRIIAFTVDDILMGASVTVPGPVRMLIDSVGGTEHLRTHMYLIALAIVIVAILRGISRYFFQFFNAKGEEGLVLRMRNILYEHIINLPMKWHNTNQTGDIIQRCTSDVDTIRTFLSDQLTNLVRVIILIILAILFMLRIHTGLTFVAIALVPVIVGYSVVFHYRIGKSFEKVDAMEGRLSAMVQENLTGVRVVRAFGREDYEKERFGEFNEKYMNTWVYLMKLLSTFWATGDFAGGIQVLLIVAIGAVLCVRGTLTAGEFIEFISYNSMLAWPVRMLGHVISDMSKAGISIDRIMYIMNSEEETDDEDAVDFPEDHDIEFKNVSFRYETGNGSEVSHYALNHVSFEIKQGSTVGILGGTGSGKTTLMQLLNRLYELKDDEGRILIGGVDIRKIKLAELRKNIGIVLQEPYLFSGTIAENIAISTGHAEMSEIKRASKIAALDETISSFTKGYDTYVGERGVTLSGGQKQRTAIAQMIVKDSPIMIFDDSLSAVDAETDRKIRDHLGDLEKGVTTVLIAHRISTLIHADTIIVLDKGQISQIGSHDKLIKENGIYRKIYELQQTV